MDRDSPSELLAAWSAGDGRARDKLMAVVYDELHLLAHRYMSRERTDHTLQTTALINEAFLKLVNQRHAKWQNRAQFFGVAAQIMRRILVDHARSRHYQKRGAGERMVSFDDVDVLSPERVAEVVALDDALETLRARDERKCRVVELRFFAGLSIKETAEVLDLSPITVKRDWAVAKAWLYREVSDRA